MMDLDSLFPRATFEDAMRQGWIVERAHPTASLRIVNYTALAQFTPGAWNTVTLQCRGLIYNPVDGRIVVRPFPKFFNYGQSEAPAIHPTAPVCVTDKLDGSLGILYPSDEGLALATRGSFDSEQARHATSLWRQRYGGYAPPAGLTLLFEIIYPANRIVVEYDGLDDLVLLGAVHIDTGHTVTPDDPRLDSWPGPRAARLAYHTLIDALAAPPRPNAEGLVVHDLTTDARVKIKQEDYLALHRIVTGLNERTVWDHLRQGNPVEDLLALLPDEFHDWVRQVAATLSDRVAQDAADVERSYAAILATTPVDRKAFAVAAVATPWRAELFTKYDHKDYHDGLWRRAMPAANARYGRG